MLTHAVQLRTNQKKKKQVAEDKVVVWDKGVSLFHFLEAALCGARGKAVSHQFQAGFVQTGQGLSRSALLYDRALL